MEITTSRSTLNSTDDTENRLPVRSLAKALDPPRRRGRSWLPLWFRFAIVSNGRGIRLVLPLLLLGPLALILLVALLPLVILGVAVISIRKRAVLGYFVQGIGILCALTTALLLHGRGTGIWVKDRDNEVGFWLS